MLHPVDIKKLILYKLLKSRVTDYFKHLHINYIIRTCIQLNSKNILKVVTNDDSELILPSNRFHFIFMKGTTTDPSFLSLW